MGEAERLNQRVEKLFAEGKYAEALPLAERALYRERWDGYRREFGGYAK